MSRDRRLFYRIQVIESDFVTLARVAARPLINSEKKIKLPDGERSRSAARSFSFIFEKGARDKRGTEERNKIKRVHTMRAVRRMGVVETRSSAFENEFKHTEARVTEVSGSVNFGDKFHEVHFG